MFVSLKNGWTQCITSKQFGSSVRKIRVRGYPCQYIEALLYLVDASLVFQNHGYKNLLYVAGRNKWTAASSLTRFIA
jgi:hypothetical protein